MLAVQENFAVVMAFAAAFGARALVNGRGFGGVDLLVGDGGLVAAVGAFGAQGVPLAVAQGAVW